MIIKKTLLALSIGGLSSLAYAEPASQEFVPTTLATTSAQGEASGFIEGQSLGGTTRNWYANELARRDSSFSYNKDGVSTPTSRRINWVQGTIVNYTSGFTQGTVGVSTELAVYNAVALDRSRRDLAGGSNRTLTEDDGDAVGQWSKLGLGNMKFRVSNTTLTAGRQSMDSPMVASIGNRALPSSFQGLAVHSAEFNNLSFDAGTFDRVSPRTEQSLTKFVSEYGNRDVSADHVNTAGVNYRPFKSLTTTLFATQAEDIWNQYYFGASHDLGDSDVFALNTSVNYYKTKNTGKSLLGGIDNDTYSLAFTGTHKAHSLTLAYQEVSGNEYFDYLHETNGIFLANSLLSDFNGPNEKSFQVAYGLNMGEYGVPGLKFSIYHARGWGIDGTHYRGTGYSGLTAMDGEHHYEYGVGTSYAVQSGPLKATTVRATYTTHRASENQADGNLNEFRLVTTVPFTIL
ncbi:OprD family porin [Pseudomonas sp. HR96]|uniref:OprD family porin n=1 Tax=Pseudomonas sp. HR96 TaxID=1027966 RepID=UPI002A75DE8A|nr:OprD family porin [Pseudomonas sp. HR96]WPO99251.1 OprD family porin [Pseudomonas sp. HR96]